MRLVRLTAQTDRIQAQLDALWSEFRAGNDQLFALTRFFTSADAGRAVEERLAELLTRQETADQQLADLTQTVTKLTRTQFKANTLGETKEQQVAAALGALQEIATRRQQAQEASVAHDEARLAQLRSDTRSELAADFLPALDGLDLALDHGRAWLQRRRQLREESARAADQAAADAAAAEVQARQAQSQGVWSKLRRVLVARPGDRSRGETSSGAPLRLRSGQALAAVSPSALPSSDDAAEAVNGWLQGLELVRERFVALLAAEGIRQIEARGRPFDPRLHLAVATELRADAPDGIVVGVQRKGYRQRERVIRYAEVIVARAPEDSAAEEPLAPPIAEHPAPAAAVMPALPINPTAYQEEERE